MTETSYYLPVSRRIQDRVFLFMDDTEMTPAPFSMNLMDYLLFRLDDIKIIMNKID